MSEQNQTTSVKSFSLEQYEKAISDAISKLTGYTEVSCSLNNFEYDVETALYKDLLGKESFNCSIRIEAKSHKELLAIIEAQKEDEIKRKEENNKNGMVDF